jgi:hypothetical protein
MSNKTPAEMVAECARMAACRVEGGIAMRHGNEQAILESFAPIQQRLEQASADAAELALLRELERGTREKPAYNTLRLYEHDTSSIAESLRKLDALRAARKEQG